MSKWIVGLLPALIGAFATWGGLVEGSIVLTASGIALIAAGVFHIVRNSSKSTGFLELAWGSAILLRNLVHGMDIRDDSAETAMQTFGLVLGVLLVIGGLWHLLRPAKAAEPSRT